MYEIIYDYDETERGLREVIEGTWEDAIRYKMDLRALGYYNIDINAIYSE